jgi:CheY-like chemotaxis protein
MSVSQIVVIEDNPADVLLIRKALQENDIPHALILFENGMEALKVLCAPDEGSIVPDAILLDLHTPRSDGFDVLVHLKQFPRLAQVPIAILTSSRAQSDKHRAAINGARYIEKPSQLTEFLSAVGQGVKAMLHRNVA